MDYSTIHCTIEHHATLFALLSKYACIKSGESGKETILLGVTKYGNQRGARMRKNALANHDPIDPLSFQAYGEWKPEYEGQMTFGISFGEPSLQTFISKCAWCDAWGKNNLLEYGKLYCINIDNAVYQGFDSSFSCTTLGSTMSFGGPQCEFDWNQPLTQEELVLLAEKKKELGSRYMKDFTYHTAHLLYTMGEVLEKELGETGSRIIDLALTDYRQLFGHDYLNVLALYSKEVF